MATAVLLVIVILLAYRMFMPGQDSTSCKIGLDDLRGVWATSNHVYKDRFLQFDGDEISFGQSEAGVSSYTVEEIDCDQTPDGFLIRISYLDLASVDYQLAFYFTSKRGGRIQMKNRTDIVWVRSSRAPAYDPNFK